LTYLGIPYLIPAPFPKTDRGLPSQRTRIQCSAVGFYPRVTVARLLGRGVDELIPSIVISECRSRVLSTRTRGNVLHISHLESSLSGICDLASAEMTDILTANKAVLVRPAVGIWIRVMARVRKSKSVFQVRGAASSDSMYRSPCVQLVTSTFHSISEDCGGLTLVSNIS